MTPMRLIRDEDVDAQLRALLAEAEERGRHAEAQAMKEGQETRLLRGKPDMAESILGNLRAALETDIVVAKRADGETVIEQLEQEREIAKRALMHIKTPQLRKIAKDLGGRSGGKLEELLEQIVRAYHGDKERIARLVVEYEAEPPPERRFATRVFHVAESMEELPRLAERAAGFSRRYIKTGIARWFVIESVDATPNEFAMRGLFRYFQADATQEDDIYRLVANEADAPVSLRLTRNQTTVEVDARGPTESRAIMSAFQRVSGLKWQEQSLWPARIPDGDLMNWDRRSVFLVDLVQARFGSDAIEIYDLNTAGFQAEDGRQSQGGEDQSMPAVKAVKLDGRHLLESDPVCELLVAGQGLVELKMSVRFRRTGDDDLLLPLTVRQERDHTAVMTGFGVVDPGVARQLHMQVVHAVRRSFRRGFVDQAGLELMAHEVSERAERAGAGRRTASTEARAESTEAVDGELEPEIDA